MMNPAKNCTLLILLTTLWACQNESTDHSGRFRSILEDTHGIAGRAEYLNTPYVTAGDRLYMVGHQDGSFPELGWHIKGEMGGIWNHPIKLMDGFEASVRLGDREIPIRNAHLFTNYPMANRHEYRMDSLELHIERWQFVPDAKQGISVSYVLQNTGDSEKPLELAFTGHADLRPTWLGERTQMKDSTDQASYDPELGAWIVKDAGNPWYVVFGSEQSPTVQEPAESPYMGKGASGTLRYQVSLAPGATRTIHFNIAGSYHSAQEAINTYLDINDQRLAYLSEKRDRYASLARLSKLTTPDTVLNQTFEWLKYNSDWLIQEVPEIGRGITAGIPDYPWWFGVDSEYALQGYMAVGQRDIVHETIALLDSVSRAVNGNGRIIHEMSTNGAVFNPGNINETPQFATLIWRTYQWNGDREFLERYFPTIRDGLNWLMAENDANKNGFPDGFGMMEIHGLDSEMIDVAAYTQAAFSHAALIAGELGESALALEYRQKALELRKKINREFWSEDFQSYADFMGTDQQALHLIEDAIVRADTLEKPWAIEELEQTLEEIKKHPGGSQSRPFVLHHNWVVNTPMEMGIADPEKAVLALETARNFVNPFGMFVTGIDRDESAGADEGSFKGSKVFSYTGAVMTLPTGVQAVAENNYGRPDLALDYLKRMTRSFSYALPGSMYEVSPDYGMIAQAWNIYSFAVPIVRQFFGIRPMASKKEIRIRPQLPTSWDQASLENVLVGENRVSVFYKEKDDGSKMIRILQDKEDWHILLDIGDYDHSAVEAIKGEVKVHSEKEDGRLECSGREIEIIYN
jgi:glycogen debranching enzyme